MASSNTLSLYVGDLCPEVNEAILFKIFNNIGEVTQVRVCRDRTTKRSRGYAYVNFKHHEDAKKAFKKLNYEPILGKPCRIMWQERDRGVRKSGFGNIYVKYIDKSIDSKGLHEMFSEFGEILSCKVATNESGESRGFGYVHFENQRDGERAIERMHGKLLNNYNKLFVCKFKGKEEGQVGKAESVSNEPVPPPNPLPYPVIPARNRDSNPMKPEVPQQDLRSETEVLYVRKSLRDRVESIELMPNAVVHSEHCKVNSRRRFSERAHRSRSAPRGPKPRGIEASAQISSDSDNDLDEATTVSDHDRIYEVASTEHPNDANLIVKLIREKCVGETLRLLCGSRALIENEVEKAYGKIRLLESPPLPPRNRYY